MTNGDSNEVLNQKLEGLYNLYEEKHKNVVSFLERIEIQTMKTNGRVNGLEEWQMTHEKEHEVTGKMVTFWGNWFSTLAGGVALALVTSVVIFFLAIFKRL